jgi:Co/Zn/Cd efflux system component
LQQGNQDALWLFHETQQQVLNVHGLVLHLIRDLLGSLDDFLCLERELVRVHSIVLQWFKIQTLLSMKYKT